MVFRENPIPYLFKSFNTLSFCYDKDLHDYVPTHKPFANLKMRLIPKDKQGKRQIVTIMHTSLYKVQKLRYAASSLLGKQFKRQFQSRYPNEIEDEYMWGVELIHLVQSKQVLILELTEEVTYFQSRLFTNFITEICDKLHANGQPLDKCKQDILEVILNQFSAKFA